MKRILIPLLAPLALPTAVNAGVDPAVHNLCKNVSDYAGCVKANKDFDPQEIKELNVFGFRYNKLHLNTAKRWEFNGTIFVLGVLKGSSADKAGLKFGDQIIRVNDKSLSKENPEESMAKIIEATKKNNLKLKIARYSLNKNNDGRNIDVIDIDMNKNKIKISAFDLLQYNDANITKQKWYAFLKSNLYTDTFTFSKSPKKVKNKRNNNLLNEVNRHNFNRIILKRDRYFKPIPQPYWDVYGTSGQYGGGY